MYQRRRILNRKICMKICYSFWIPAQSLSAVVGNTRMTDLVSEDSGPVPILSGNDIQKSIRLTPMQPEVGASKRGIEEFF